MEAPALLFRNYLVGIGAGILTCGMYWRARKHIYSLARRYTRAPAYSNYLNQ